MILAAAAKCTPLIAHHLEPLLLLQGSTCLIRWGRRRCSGVATPCTCSASTRCWSTTSKRPCLPCFCCCWRQVGVSFVSCGLLLLPWIGWITTLCCPCRFSCPICATSIFDMDKFFKALDAEVLRESLAHSRHLKLLSVFRLASRVFWLAARKCSGF